MNESINHVEYVVEQKPEGKNLTLRILLIAGYILFGLAYFIFFTVKLKIVMLISLLPVFIWMLVFFTWRFAAVEHEYQKQIKNCPHEKVSNRPQVREILKRMEELNPNAASSLWGAMTNIQEEYLP